MYYVGCGRDVLKERTKLTTELFLKDQFIALFV